MEQKTNTRHFCLRLRRNKNMPAPCKSWRKQSSLLSALAKVTKYGTPFGAPYFVLVAGPGLAPGSQGYAYHLRLSPPEMFVVWTIPFRDLADLPTSLYTCPAIVLRFKNFYFLKLRLGLARYCLFWHNLCLM